MSEVFSELKLTDLRLKREELFVDLWETEELIRQTLGAPYTFETLPELLSHKKKKVGSRGKKAAKVAAFKLRPLSAEESYYRLTYLSGLESSTEEYMTADADSIRAFLKAGERCLSIQKIETLVYSADGLYD